MLKAFCWKGTGRWELFAPAEHITLCTGRERWCRRERTFFKNFWRTLTRGKLFSQSQTPLRSAVIGRIIFKVVLSISYVYHKLLNTVPSSTFPGPWRLPSLHGCRVDAAAFFLLRSWGATGAGQAGISGEADHSTSTGSSFCLSGHFASFPLPLSRKDQHESVLVVGALVLLMGAAGQPL